MKKAQKQKVKEKGYNFLGSTQIKYLTGIIIFKLQN